MNVYRCQVVLEVPPTSFNTIPNLFYFHGSMALFLDYATTNKLFVFDIRGLEKPFEWVLMKLSDLLDIKDSEWIQVKDPTSWKLVFNSQAKAPRTKKRLQGQIEGDYIESVQDLKQEIEQFRLKLRNNECCMVSENPEPLGRKAITDVLTSIVI